MATSSSERTVTLAFDYHLTHDKVRRENVPTQGYNGLDSYILNVDKGL